MARIAEGADALQISWPVPRHVPRLIDGAVHVWAAPLDVSPDRLAQLTASLSPDERERARKFRFAELTHRFIAARAQLRALLAVYVEANPEDIRFEYSPHGKPRLAGAMFSRSRVHFSVAHAGGLALFAVSTLGPLGVDVEEMKPLSDTDRIAEHFFSLEERRQLAGVESRLAGQSFYCCWTRKEAYLKALGTGLLAPLDRFDVSVVPDEPAALLHVHGDEDAPTRWSLRHLDPAPGYVGALAVEAADPVVCCLRWLADENE